MNLKKINQAIKKYKTFLVTTHVNPDVDAIASELAMALYLRKLGKKVFVVNSEDVPVRLQFLPKTDLIRKADFYKSISYDVLVALDCGDFDRIDQVKRLSDPDKVVINIDHHLTNTMFGTINLVNPDASSASEMLADFFEYNRFPVDRDTAILLYTGIMTDTGSFRYDSTTPHSHDIAGRLMKFNFSVSELYRQLYERIPLKDFKHFTQVLNDFEIFYQGRVLCVTLRKKTLQQFSPEFDIRDKIFSFLRAIKGVEVIIILTEDTPKLTRINLRAQGQTANVAHLARFFGGGGHKKASGCTISDSLKKSKQKILAKLEQML